jgi:hypothetical protein
MGEGISSSTDLFVPFAISRLGISSSTPSTALMMVITM